MSTIIVKSNADSGAGTLRQAIANAKDGDTIKFAADLAGKTIRLTSGQLELTPGKDLIIDGKDAKGLTISGGNQSRIFMVRSNQDFPTQLMVKNLTLSDASTSEEGGAIGTEHRASVVAQKVKFLNNAADRGGGAIFGAFETTVKVTRCTFRGNDGTGGNNERGAGAIAVRGDRLVVQHSSFIKNRGINGGAINVLTCELIVDDSKFIDNNTKAGVVDNNAPNGFLRGFGGAIYTDRASSADPSDAGVIQITDSWFEGNEGRGSGGAAYLYAGYPDKVIIEGTTFLSNRVERSSNGENGDGGAVWQGNAELLIRNSTFAKNVSQVSGGGLRLNVSDAKATIINSTFSGNKVLASTTNANGGAMALYAPTEIINTTIANNRAGWVGGAILASSKPVSVQNTIFYNNTALNGGNPWNIQQQTSRQLTDNGGNIQFPPKATNAGNDFNATDSILIVDPKLGALKDNGGGIFTHALLPGSPAINAGVRNDAPNRDERGVVRDSRPDVGAFEFVRRSRTLEGSDGEDRLNGDGSDNALAGGDANDVLLGSDGDDILRGGAGDDKLLGGRGGDRLVGGTGDDVLTGGSGGDRFVFNTLADSHDLITDFQPQEDRLNLRRLFDSKDFASMNPLRDYVELVQVGSDTVVRIAQGDANSKPFQDLVTLENVKADSLSAAQFIV
jgi:Ca2+-binding RTX toxin-like protein